MAKVVTVRPGGVHSVDEITDDPNRFLSEVYGLIGYGCDIVQCFNLGDGMYLLVDEEGLMRPVQHRNDALDLTLFAMGCNPVGAVNAGVFVGTVDDDLGTLNDREVAIVVAAVETVKRVRR